MRRANAFLRSVAHNRGMLRLRDLAGCTALGLGLGACAGAPPSASVQPPTVAPRPPPSCRIMGEPFVGIATYVARETQDRGHDALVLGVVTYTSGSTIAGVSYPAQPRVVEHLLVTGTKDSMRDPVLASFGGDGFALAWVQGQHIRVQPIQGGAQLVGTPIEVSPPTTGELGPPALVFDGHGGGLVAFAAPSAHGLDVIATPIACTP